MATTRDKGGTASTAEKIRLVVAEDQTLLAGGLPDLLHTASSGRIEVVQTCLNRRQLFRTLKKMTPDVLLCDVWMPNNSGDPPMPCDAPLLEAIKQQSPDTAILLLSSNSDAILAKNLLDAGADGFLDKDVAPEQLCQAIERVRQGHRYITPRFQAAIDLLSAGSNQSIRTQLLKGRRGDVLRLLLEGLSPTEIAAVLLIGKKYVDKKIAEIKSILGVKTHIRIFRTCIVLGITKLSNGVADASDTSSHYDAARALLIASGIPAIRDRIVNGILDLFATGGELAALFDVSLYRSNPTRSRALAHTAVGLAQQAAMPRLESLCSELETALASGELVTAEELGRNLPAMVALVRAAVAAESA